MGPSWVLPVPGGPMLAHKPCYRGSLQGDCRENSINKLYCHTILHMHALYHMKHAQASPFVEFCYRQVSADLLISVRVTALALKQSHDCIDATALGEHTALTRDISGHQSTISSQPSIFYFTVWTLLMCDFNAVILVPLWYFVCVLTDCFYIYYSSLELCLFTLLPWLPRYCVSPCSHGLV